jgi:class 3 adenylate cyclase
VVTKNVVKLQMYSPWERERAIGRFVDHYNHRRLDESGPPLFAPCPPYSPAGPAMTCPLCQHENRSGAKFCEECAAPLPRPCANCGAHLRACAKFCDECGTSTGAAPAPTPAADADGTRKVVTVMFAELVGSTALHERLDAESARLFMEGYYRAMRGAVEQHGGRVAKLLGDGVMAVFGLPLVAEGDAIRAVRAAVDMQRVFRELAEWHSNLVGKVGLRVAVNTGEVVAKDETELIGDPVNVAARLQDQGRDGDVVIGECR